MAYSRDLPKMARQHTQYSVRTFHKYGFDKDLESHGRGWEGMAGHICGTFGANRGPGGWGGSFFFGVFGFGHTVTTSQLLNQ